MRDALLTLTGTIPAAAATSYPTLPSAMGSLAYVDLGLLPSPALGGAGSAVPGQSLYALTPDQSWRGLVVDIWVPAMAAHTTSGKPVTWVLQDTPATQNAQNCPLAPSAGYSAVGSGGWTTINDAGTLSVDGVASTGSVAVRQRLTLTRAPQGPLRVACSNASGGDTITATYTVTFSWPQS